MAINKFMLAAMKALSSHDLDVKKNYHLDRAITEFIHPPVIRPFRVWDEEPMINGRKVPVRIFTPEKERGRGIFLFFHGGGWVSGNTDAYTNSCTTLADETGLCVLSVDYCLAPENPFPAAPEECYAVAKSLFEHISDFGLEKEDIILIGDSAGANLCAVVSLMARDRGEFSVARQILLYPCTASYHGDDSKYRSVGEFGTDYVLTSKKIRDYTELYLTKPEDHENPYFAPLLVESLQNQPKTLVLTAECDPLRDEGEAYAARLSDDGNDVTLYRIPDSIHGFFNMPIIFDQTRLCFEKINEFLISNNK